MRIPFLRRLRSHQIEALYREHAPSLLAYARSFGLDAATAEDVLHQVFLRVFENAEALKEPRPYLFRAIRNTSLNRVRDGSRDVELAENEPWFAVKEYDPVHEVDLRRALAALPPDQRGVVMLHVWGGLSFEEVGEVVDISPNTASSRYRYALASLRRVLKTDKRLSEHG